MTDQPSAEVNRYAQLGPEAQALVDDHDQIALAEMLAAAKNDIAACEAQQWPQRLARAEEECRRYAEADSADAAAGSYAGRAERVEAQLAHVRRLHRPVGVVAAAEAGEPPDCAACRRAWPCQTYSAVTDEDANAEPSPRHWLLQGTRDLSIPNVPRLTYRPVTPEMERAATERAEQAAADSERSAAWFAATGGVLGTSMNESEQPRTAANNATAPPDPRAQIDTALRTTPRADCADWPPREAHGQGHRYDMRCALCTSDVDALTDAVLAALQPRLAALAAYENAITWHTDCLNCARILDSAIRDHERADRLGAALREVLDAQDESEFHGPAREQHDRWRTVLNEPQPEPGTHIYLSTGCFHGDHDYCKSMTGLAGAKRPGECKKCAAKCICSCHSEGQQP